MGRSARTISRIALGCGNFGGVGSAPEFFGQGLSEDQALRADGRGLGRPASPISTPPTPTAAGAVSCAIGRWIASRGVRPQLTTKTYNPMRGRGGSRPEARADRPPAAREPGPARGRPGRAVPRPRLRPAGAAAGVVRPRSTQAQADGAIGGYGVSNFGAAQLAAALAAGTPQAIQNSYSLLARQDEPELLPLCAARGVAYLAYSPLAGGWLTGKYRRGEPFPAGSRMTQRPEPYRELVTG